MRLFLLLLRRDLRLRYAGAGLGALWNLVHPVFLFAVYFLVFGCFLRFKAKLLGHEVDFLPFLFAGFWPWVAFSEGLGRCGHVVLEYGVVLKRVRFPAGVLVPLAVASALVPLAVGLALLLVFLWWRGDLPPAGCLPWLVVPFGLQVLLGLGLGYLVALVSVFVRDFQPLLPTLLNLWFFLTPVFYSLDLVPGWLRGALALNPWSVILVWYRQVLLSGEVRFGQGEGWVLALGLALLWVGLVAFRRGSRHFPDVL